jgi:energy-coupling factor transporter ATP-binding protein EcfA2
VINQVTPVVELRNVSFSYEHRSEQLRDINLTIAPGECVVFTGSSGSGKTTLTRLVNGLIPHFYPGKLNGTVSIRGVPSNDLPIWEFGRRVGSVFQDSRSQFFTSRVRDEVVFGAENYQTDPEVMHTRLPMVLEELGITALEGRSLANLSSGEKQKVSVAATRMLDPDIFVLDEPSANLDLASSFQLGKILGELKAQGKTIILAEHRLFYLMDFVDRIIHVQEGQITAKWSPEELRSSNPRQPEEIFQLRTLEVVPPTEGQTWNPSAEAPIIIENLTLGVSRLAPPLLTNLNFQLGRGEILALSGPNGVGKTTLAKTLCGLHRQRQGQISLDGRLLNQKQRISLSWLVLQDSDHQLFAESVQAELLLGNSGKESRARELLERLDLDQTRDRHPATLSGGQKQRLTLAIGLMNNPELLILDEPTSGLDKENFLKVQNLLQEVARQGTRILVISHDFEFILGTCTRFLYLQPQESLKDLPVQENTYQEILTTLMGNLHSLQEEYLCDKR